MRDDDDMVVGPVTTRTPAEVQATTAWNAALRPEAVRGLEQKWIASSLVRYKGQVRTWSEAEALGQADYDRLSQAPRSAPSPAPDPYAAWIA